VNALQRQLIAVTVLSQFWQKQLLERLQEQLLQQEEQNAEL